MYWANKEYTPEEIERYNQLNKSITDYRTTQEKRRLQRLLRTKKRKLIKANNRRAK